MDDIERDGDITINVGFGNITFFRSESGTFAQAVIDMTARDRPHDRIELALRVPASHHDPIIDVVERSRCHVIALLQAAVDRMQAETAETLLYHSG